MATIALHSQVTRFEMTDLPYQVEYAKTGRASCKACKAKIDQGDLRIAIMVQVNAILLIS